MMDVGSSVIGTRGMMVDDRDLTITVVVNRALTGMRAHPIPAITEPVVVYIGEC